jgi:hypothetical protein
LTPYFSTLRMWCCKVIRVKAIDLCGVAGVMVYLHVAHSGSHEVQVLLPGQGQGHKCK